MVRRKISTALGIVLVASQAVRFERTNPPVTGDFSASPAIKSTLREACYDCHSNETKWPEYTAVAPISWIAHYDVSEGRRRLNFSNWTAYASDPGTKSRKLVEIRALVKTGDMPPWYYRLVHLRTRWTEAQRNAVVDWVDQEIAGSPSGE